MLYFVAKLRRYWSVFHDPFRALSDTNWFYIARYSTRRLNGPEAVKADGPKSVMFGCVIIVLMVLMIGGVA